MKITISVPGRWHAFDLARELHKHGHLFRIITTYPKSRTRAYDLPDDKVVSFWWMIYFERAIQKILGISIWRKYFSAFHAGIYSLLASFYIRGSDIVHGWSGSSSQIFRKAKKNNIVCVLERSSSHILTQSKILENEYRKYGLKWASTPAKIIKNEIEEYEIADEIFVPSEFVNKSFLQNGVRIEKLFKNNFGTDLSCFRNERTEFNINGPINCIFTSSRSARKGIIYMKNAFAEIDNTVANLLLVGSTEKEVTPFIPKGENIHVLEHVPQKKLSKFYNKSDVFIHPSVEEGLAYVQAQALAAGLVLVCTTNTGGEDLLKLSNVEPTIFEKNILQYPAGFVIPAYEYLPIKKCIIELYNNRDLLHSMQKEAFKLCDKGNSWATYANRCINEYKKLLENK